MSQSITFISRCPTCGHPQLQDGYTRAALNKLLERGRIIEADCLNCDVLWPISPEERAALAEMIAVEHEGAASSAGDHAPNGHLTQGGNNGVAFRRRFRHVQTEIVKHLVAFFAAPH